MTQEELNKLLENHKHWLNEDCDGWESMRANLREADIEGANLCVDDLCGAKLPTGMYQIVGAGSYNRCTTYDTINDQVICGCWNDGAGNRLDSFVRRIESIYGQNGEEPNSVYYAEYMSAISFFKAVKELNKKS